MSELDQHRITSALSEVWASIDELCGDLTDDQWALPVPLPAWDVRATFVHVFGTEAMLLGRQPSVQVDADARDHVRNPIGAINESWIETYADASAPELLAAYRQLVTERLRALGEMSPDAWQEVGFTPAGKAPYGRFMQIRVFDCWMHEQDMRVALGRPGHHSGPAAEVTLDEMANAMGFVVGKRAGAPSGSSVTFDLTGDVARQIHVVVGERAEVVEALDGPATATLTLPSWSFTRIAGGRTDAPAELARCDVAGDAELGARVLQNLAYTI